MPDISPSFAMATMVGANKKAIIDLLRKGSSSIWFDSIRTNVLSNLSWFFDNKSDYYYQANMAGTGVSFGGINGLGLGWLAGVQLDNYNHNLNEFALDRGPLMADEYPFTANINELSRLMNRRVMLSMSIPFSIPSAADNGMGLPIDYERLNSEQIKYVDEKTDLINQYISRSSAPFSYQNDWEGINAEIGIPSSSDSLSKPTSSDSWRKRQLDDVFYRAWQDTKAKEPKPMDGLIQLAYNSPFIPKVSSASDSGYMPLQDDWSSITQEIEFIKAYQSLQDDWNTINQEIEANKQAAAQREVNPLGSALSTAYDLFSFSDVLTDVISGRRSDPGAYISLANYAAQGLNWAAGDNGVQDIISAIGELKDPLETVSHATGAAGSAWGLYKNIEGLASGDFNTRDKLNFARKACSGN